MRRKVTFLAFATLACSTLLLAGGCRRGEEEKDTRTLEQRPHTETVKPVDRTDAFRP